MQSFVSTKLLLYRSSWPIRFDFVDIYPPSGPIHRLGSHSTKAVTMMLAKQGPSRVFQICIWYTPAVYQTPAGMAY